MRLAGAHAHVATSRVGCTPKSRCGTANPGIRAAVSAAFRQSRAVKGRRVDPAWRVTRHPPPHRHVLARAASPDVEGQNASDTGSAPASVDEDANDESPSIEIPERPKHFTTVDEFLPADGLGGANALRNVFDTHHDDPQRTHEHRFVWDYWHVPDQYTLLRTPAADYFPEKDFAALESSLQTYASQTLGCAGITLVWLSVYVEGMRQELHADVPHGPWAFVLSLTNLGEGNFSGGETLMLKPETLDYFRHFDSNSVVERGNLVELIQPKFNRLTVFDPRVPHGVQVVEGTRDPKKGRLVLHGWFNDPAPCVFGALEKSETRKKETLEILEQNILPPLFATLGELPRARGTVVVQVTIEPDGTMSDTKWSADSLVPFPSEFDPVETRDAILIEIAAAFRENLNLFPVCDGESTLTVPFMFD